MGIGRWIEERRRAFWTRRAPGFLEYLNRKVPEDLEKGKLRWLLSDVAQARRVSRKWLAEEDLRSLDGIRDFVVERYEAGDQERARELCRMWLEVVIDQLRRGSPYLGYLDNLEEILFIGGDYAGIESKLRILEDQWRSAGQYDKLLPVLLGLAQVSQSAGRMNEAERAMREAVSFWEQGFSRNDGLYIEKLDDLKEILVANGRHREAAQVAQKALAKMRGDPSNPIDSCQEAIRTSELSLYSLVDGDFTRARELLDEADTFLCQAEEKESLGSSSAERWQRVARLLGTRLLSVFDTLREMKTNDMVWNPLKLAQIYEAIEVSPTPLETAEYLFLMAEMFLQMNLGQEPSFLSSESAFAELFSKLEQLDLDQDVEDTEDTFPSELMDQLNPIRPSYNRILQDLVDHPDLCSPEEAEARIRAAVEGRASALGEHHPETTFARFKLAQYLEKRGENGEVETLLRRVVADWRAAREENQLYLPLALSALAGLCATTGREEEAWHLLTEVVKLEDHLIANIFSFTSEEQRRLFLRSLENTYDRSLAIVWKLAPVSPEVTREAFDLVLRRKGLVGRAQLAQWASALGNEDPRIRELGTVRQEITELLLAGEKTEGSEKLKALSESRETLEAAMARSVADTAWLRELGPVDLESFCQALPPGSALLELVVVETKAQGVFNLDRGFSPHYLAFFLPAGDSHGLRLLDLGETGPIDTAIDELRSLATCGHGYGRELDQPEGRDRPSEKIETKWLRELLVAPLLDLAGERTHLLISPDGDLNLLPFEILPDGEDRHLIDRYTISYLSSGREALRFRDDLSGRSQASVVIAGPDYNLGLDKEALQGSDLLFSILDHAPAEGEEIARLLHVEPLTGAGAVESELRKVHSPHILHLATHGFLFDDEDRRPQRLREIEAMNPLLQSGLALAGANTWLAGGQPPSEAGDGLLTAAEVASLDLVDTELVVLSACKTGLGEVRAGEGVQGLRRSFALAGARTLVMSLWEVPDQETRELMETFYRYLKTMGRAEALRRAQLDLKEKGCSVKAWGAFICQGDPGPLLLPLDWAPLATAPPAPGHVA